MITSTHYRRYVEFCSKQTLSPSSFNSLVKTIGKVRSLSGTQTLIGDVTLSPTTYKFSGALPAEIGYFNGVTSALQTQSVTFIKLGGAYTITSESLLHPTNSSLVVLHLQR